MPPVCKYYLQGSCRFGDRCRYEHTGANQSQNYNQNQNQNRNQPQPRYQNQGENQNRYGAFQGGSGNPPSGPRGNQGGRNYNSRTRELPYHLNAEVVGADLREDLPTWILSEYGPGRNAPRGLFGSGIEMSPEEMRTLYYLGMANGNVQQAQQHEFNLVNQARQTHQKVLNDLDGAINYVIDGENVHPNRLDIVNQSTSSSRQNENQSPNALLHNRPPTSSQGVFGRPSQPDTQPAFGRPSFGQPSAPAFGQPSAPAFGQPSAPTYGKPSAPAFGQPSAPAFGRPTPFGQTTSFGQPSPSPFGTAAAAAPSTAPTGSFGQPSGPTPTTAFPTAFDAARSGGFGQGPQQSQQTSGFGQPQPTPFGTAPGAISTGGFGQPSAPAPPNPFSTAPGVAAPSTGFGQPFERTVTNTLNAISTAVNGISSAGGFGQSPLPPSASPFSTTPAATAARPSAQPAQSMTLGSSTQTNGALKSLDDLPATPFPQSPPSTYTTKDATGRLTSWKGRPVRYLPLPADQGTDKPPPPLPHYQRADTGDWERIWFPDGAPPANPDTAPDPQRWNEKVAKAYNYVREVGAFWEGVMPEEPPGWEFVRWDV